MHVKRRETALFLMFIVVGVLVVGLAPLSPLQAQGDPIATPTLNSSVSDGHIRNSGYPYNTVHDSVDGTVQSERIYAGQYKYPGTYYEIYRGFVFFDTSELPDYCTIISATLFLCTAADGSYTDFDVVIQNGQPDYPHDPLMPDDYDKTHYAGSGGSFNTADLAIVGEYSAIPLNSDGLDWIVKTGITKLCLRSSRDINSVVPTGLERVEFYAAESVEFAPELEVIIERPPATIDITAPANIAGWGLSSQGEQPKTQQGTLTITTTYADDIDWTVMASDSDPQTSGYMTKWNESSGYDTEVKLQTAMQVEGSAGTATLPDGAVVVAETGTVTGAEYDITFKQTVLSFDAATHPDLYRIVVTFTAVI